MTTAGRTAADFAAARPLTAGREGRRPLAANAHIDAKRPGGDAFSLVSHSIQSHAGSVSNLVGSRSARPLRLRLTGRRPGDSKERRPILTLPPPTPRQERSSSFGRDMIVAARCRLVSGDLGHFGVARGSCAVVIPAAHWRHPSLSALPRLITTHPARTGRRLTAVNKQSRS